MSEGALIGIDIGGTNCRGATVDGDGRVGPLRRIATGEGPADDFLDRLVDFVSYLRGSSDRRETDGLGIGVPGIISPEGEILESPNLRFLDGFALQRTLGERLDMPVRVVNDVNAIAWGEAVAGAGRKMNSFVAVALGTGVGGGLILERRLWLGADGLAGEIGHVPVEANGRPCGCGARGCLEQYASATGILKTIVEQRKAGLTGSLDEVEVGNLTTKKIADAAGRGDAAARSSFAEAGARLGQALAGIVNLLNPDGVVVTGGVSTSFDLMEPAVRKELEERCFERSLRSLDLRRGELDDRAGILGAALLSRPA